MIAVVDQASSLLDNVPEEEAEERLVQRAVQAVESPRTVVTVRLLISLDFLMNGAHPSQQLKK